MILHHGTKNKTLVPSFYFKNEGCDYGNGFYTTSDLTLGKEWASGYSINVRNTMEAYVYSYKIDLNQLKVLYLDEYDVLHWVAELMYHRKDTSKRTNLFKARKEKFLQKYKIDTSQYDVIVGYRADDSFFLYYQDFINGDITKDTLESALKLGNLGVQYVIKSEKAYDLLDEIDKNSLTLHEIEKYKNSFNERDLKARELYRYNRDNQDINGLTIFDILRSDS